MSPAMSPAPPDRHVCMADVIRQLKTLEGRRVSVAVRNGTRFDDCQLVSVGRGRASTVWVFINGIDTFLATADVIDVWAAA
jgi:hypothetical protein